MVKSLLNIMVSIFVVLLLSGCMNNENVTEELIKYHNEDWKTLQEMKREKIKPITSEYITFALDADDEKIGILIEDELLPSQKEIVEYLESIQLETKELQKLNQLQIEAEEFGYDFFEGQVDVLNRGDTNEIDAMYEQFDEDQKELEEKYDEVENERDKLMEKYDVQFVDDIDEAGREVLKMVRKED